MHAVTAIIAFRIRALMAARIGPRASAQMAETRQVSQPRPRRKSSAERCRQSPIHDATIRNLEDDGIGGSNSHVVPSCSRDGAGKLRYGVPLPNVARLPCAEQDENQNGTPKEPATVGGKWENSNLRQGQPELPDAHPLSRRFLQWNLHFSP